ncbi:MAG: Ig-like domain-containing protein [Defluviitaleaceae bacterium]|nr:Ig-like domain-containing protein [Defluviitaleaceae bacterium]
MAKIKRFIFPVVIGILVAVAASLFIIINTRDVAETDLTAQDTPTMPPLHTTQLPSPYETMPTFYENGLIFAPSALGNLIITPLSYSNLGVYTDSPFLIYSANGILTEEYLNTNLSVPTGEAFTLEAQPAGDFLLRFAEELSPNRIVNFIYSPAQMQPASHAFQTVDIFRISATSPADNSRGIPQDAGIEVTFSQPVSPDEFAAHFSIDPPVDGFFLQRDNTHIFAPHALEFNTLYTVTISAEITSKLGETMPQPHQFDFTTTWGTATTNAVSISGSIYETFLPWDEVLIALNVAEELRDNIFQLNLYEIPDAATFLDSNLAIRSLQNPIAAMQIELYTIELSEWSRFHYLFLEKTLPVGYYVAEIRLQTSLPEEIVLHKFIQVSPIAVYSLSVEGDTVFWVHDASTGLPAAGANINIDDAVTTTNSYGLAIAQAASNSRATITIEYDGHLPFAYAKPTFSARRLLPRERFLSYIYTDRPNYRPSDTVDVFGVIMPLYGHAHLPEDVFTLRVGNMIELPIVLDANHSFSKRIPVSDMFGFTDIIVEVNGQRLMSTWVQFIDYANLTYVIEASLNQAAFNLGEVAYLEIFTATFAGMPAGDVTFTGENITIETDASGIGTASITVDQDVQGSNWINNEWHEDDPDWFPRWRNFWFSTTSTMQANQGVSIPFVVAHRDIMLEHDYEGGSEMNITTSHITLDRLNSEELRRWQHFTDDMLRGAAVDVDFTLHVTRHVTTRTVRHRSYDRIQRRVITRYNFDTVSSPYRTIQGRTEGGRATVTDLPYSSDPLIRYSIYIRYQDTQGRGVRAQIHDRSWFQAQQETSMRHFGFILENRQVRIGDDINISVVESTDPWRFSDHWWALEWGEVEGDTIIPAEGRILAVLVRDGVLDTVVGDAHGVSMPFPEAAISNALLFGAFFDGRNIFAIPNPISVHYDFTQREMQVELDFCQEIYAPGDEVTVSIQISCETGSPVAGQVLISVVDEASIIHGWHAANFLSRLYGSSHITPWDIRFHQFASFVQHNINSGGGGAEGGGGSDEGVDLTFRDDFVDNPIFETVNVDASGMASFTFTLPHQVTSWRVTAIGLNDDGLAGDIIENIPSALPFYISLLHTNRYVYGDDIAAMVRVFGTGGRHNEIDIDFIFEVLQDDEVIFRDSQTGLGNIIFNAGKLSLGSYTLRAHATWGNYQDGIELPFEVVEADMIIPIRVEGQVSPEAPDIGQLYMLPLPVRVTLTNANIRPFIGVINSFTDNASFRTDYIAGTAFADYFFGNILPWMETDEDYDFTAAVRARIHDTDGGIPELTFERSDFFYTMRFVSSLPEFVDHDEIRRFLRSNEQHDYSMMRAAALMAQAAMGDPVLLDIWREAAEPIFGKLHESHLTPEQAILILASGDWGDYLSAWEVGSPYETFQRLQTQRHNQLAWLYLTAALVAIGDYNGAQAMLDLFTPLAIVPEYHQERINTLLLFINTSLNPQAAWRHINCPDARRNRYVSDVPERINFIRNAYLLGETYSTLQYYLHGETHTLLLENLARHTLHISQEQFDNLNLTPISGQTDFAVRFFDSGVGNFDPAGNVIPINRSIERVGEMVRISIELSLPPNRDNFILYDRLPSNLRFVPMRQANQDAFVHNTQRQLVEIHFSHIPNALAVRNVTRVITYYAIELFEGDMADGITIITNGRMDGHLWGVTE